MNTGDYECPPEVPFIEELYNTIFEHKPLYLSGLEEDVIIKTFKRVQIIHLYLLDRSEE